MSKYWCITGIFFLLLYTSVLNDVCGQSKDFSIGVYDTVHSAILRQERRILVFVPPGGRDMSVRYPVLFLLDGESHFLKTIGIIDHLSNTAGNELVPEMIVVAVFNENREEDFIPSSGKNTVTPDKFPLFLEKELIPYVDSHYATQPYRVLMGHSLGGLRVINTVVYQPGLFNAYVALDPSVGHVKGWIQKANEDFKKNTYDNKSLYIAMGLTMPQGMDTAVIFKDTSDAARHMRSIMLFSKNVQAENRGLDFKWKYYPDESHQSVVFKGSYDGLISDFNWFKNEKLYDIFNPKVDAATSVRIITDYYAFLSGKMGYYITPPEKGTSDLIDYLVFKRWYDKALAFAELNLKNYPGSSGTRHQLEAVEWKLKTDISGFYPGKSIRQICSILRKEFLSRQPGYYFSENEINAFGYDLMQQRSLTDAELIFKLNVELYPDSYNVYDSYGECLLSLGKEKMAIVAYKKSLELNPENTNAIKVLEKLGITRN